MNKESKWYMQISNHLKLVKSTMTTIIHHHNRQPEYPVWLTKQVGRPLKLDKQAKRLLIYHIEQNPYNNLKALGTLSKSDQTLF